MAGTPVPSIPKAPTTPPLVALLTQTRSSLSLHFPCMASIPLSSRGDHTPGCAKHQFQIKNREVPWRLVTLLRPTCLWPTILRVNEGACVPVASEVQLSCSVQVSGTEEGWGFCRTVSVSYCQARIHANGTHSSLLVPDFPILPTMFNGAFSPTLAPTQTKA